MRHPRRLRSSLVAAAGAGALAAAGLLGSPASTAATQDTGDTHPTRSTSSSAAASTASKDSKDTIVQLFQWPWKSIAKECTDHLGPDGYGAVQTSPPAESASVSGHAWWEVYQPISYKLTSRMGDKDAYADMVKTCHSAGVKVYADILFNHMTGQDDGATGYGGTTISNKYESPDLYQRQDFHSKDDCPSDDGEIHDYGNREEVQNCELTGLADLKTGDASVQKKIAGYVDTLTGLGVDGFRVDAAKHVPADDIAAIKDKADGDPYLYQEVIPGDVVEPSEYEGNGDLLEFTYGRKLKSFFGDGNLAGLKNFGQDDGMEPSDKSVVFVDNHDTERDGSTLTYKDGDNYTLANVFELAWSFGTPKIMSSFTFSGHDDSPPADSDGTVNAVNCGSGWECQHRSQPIAGMVGFHNAVQGAKVANWWDNGSDQIAFSRGSQGFVAMNQGDGELKRTFDTGLAAGTYCDVISGTAAKKSCDNTVTVDDDGKATLTVQPNSAVALHVDATSNVT